MQAEYVVLNETCLKTLWMWKLVSDFDATQDAPIILRDYNQSCSTFVQSERSGRRSKHIDTEERFIQEHCKKKEIILENCPTGGMLANLLMKPLGPLKHQ